MIQNLKSYRMGCFLNLPRKKKYF